MGLIALNACIVSSDRMYEVDGSALDKVLLIIG